MKTYDRKVSKLPFLFGLYLLSLQPWFSYAADELPSANKIKNVLFIISDDLRANVLGCYGDPLCKTPNIDKLANQGVVFERAYCQGTVCGPSRISMMYSQYQGKGAITLGEQMRKAGRYSARVGKIFHMRVPGDIIAGTNGQDVSESWTERFNSPGLEAHTPGDYACLNLNIFTTELEGRQSTRMPHRMFVSVKYEGDGADQPDHKTATKTIELLQKHRDESFFLAAGFIRPHYPMVAPEQYFSPYPFQKMNLPELREGDLEDIPPMGITRSRSAINGIDKFPDNQKRMWSAYYASVTFMDEQVGRVLDELDRIGLRDSTAIVFTSDHGYHLGDHTFWQKANLHEEVIRVPLIISAPGIKAARSKSVVELVDLFPTLCELTELPIPRGVEGTTLVPVLKDPSQTVKQGALSFVRGGISWRTPNWAYMLYKDGSEELYNMETDPGQFDNLAKDNKYEKILKEHAEQLQRMIKERNLKF